MNSSFSQALELRGMSSATTTVISLMIIFLIALVLAIGFFFIKSLEKKRFQKKELSDLSKSTKKTKGF